MRDLTTVYALGEIKKALDEFTKIAIEDNISKIQIHNVFHPIGLSFVNHWSTDKLLEEVKEYSDREIAPSEIIGRTIISKRLLKKCSLLSPNTTNVHMT